MHMQVTKIVLVHILSVHTRKPYTNDRKFSLFTILHNKLSLSRHLVALYNLIPKCNFS